MEVTILGSGSAFNGARGPAGYAARLGRRVLLFDLGFGNARRLARAGLDPRAVSDAFFTHRHPDHVGDLAALLFFLRCEAKPAGGRLRLWGPPGFPAFVRRLRAAHAPWCEPKGYALEVGELRDGSAVERDGWRLRALAVPHPTPALAYRLTYKRKALVYSGDTGFCPALADFAAEADLLLLECGCGARRPQPGHLTPRLALATLAASHCRRGLLTHVSREAESELGRLRLGRFTVARDGQRLSL